MKHCTKCGREYHDSSLKFCMEDGTPLIPQYDAEAETLTISEITDLDVQMELTEYLRELTVNEAGKEILIRFEELRSLGSLNLSVYQISRNFSDAASKAGLTVVGVTSTRATIFKPLSEKYW